MENEGGIGTKNNHFEERLFMNEIMTGLIENGDFMFSIFTMRIFEDSG